MKKKVVSLVLAVAMCFSLLTISAPSAVAYEHTPTVSVFNGYCNALFDFVSTTYQFATGKEVTSSDINAIASQLKFPRVGKVSYSALEDCVDYYNASLYGHLNALIGNGKFQSRGAVRYDADNGIYRIYDHAVGYWVSDSNGDFPYTLASELSGDVPAGEEQDAGAAQWLSASGTEITNNFRVFSYDALAARAMELSEWGHPCELVQVRIGPKGKEVNCWAIRDDYWYYYCDQNGNRYVALIDDTVTETVRPSIDNSGNLIEGDNGLILDIENGVLNLIDQVGDQHQLTIEDLEFDFGDNNYTVNAFVKEGDTYNYFTYEVTYNITNTYITYIGSNEPYERKEYELYYQLPDGRSSADLTAEEVAGMSFEFYDVVNYQRSTDDVSVRALYHFDGNLEDSSYFTGQHSGLVWTEGASITYMESPGAFEGNLYLDNTAHAFVLSQPSPIGTGDFQIQFRYYQASEIDTVNNIENRLNIGGIVLRWDESVLYNGDIELCALPIGTWNEICVSRYDGRLYIYLNGLCVYSGLNDTFVPRFFEFTFGSTSRAYSMLDELRVLNVCPIAGATNYNCTTVPYDSNLVLVLPDVDRPLADEYYIITPDPNDLFGGKYNFTNLRYGDEVTGFKPSSSTASYGSGLWTHNDMSFAYRTANTSVSAIDGGISVSSSSIKYDKDVNGGLVLCTGCNLQKDKTYTLTLVLSDYSVQHLVFSTKQVRNSNGSGVNGSSRWEHYVQHGYFQTSYTVKNFSNGFFVDGLFTRAYTKNAHYVDSCIVLYPASTSQTLEIAYMSLVEGTESAVSVEKVTSIFGRDDLQPNTAAIQTTIPVAGYTVGGVRPTMPAKGDLWFPVMENRITGVQIYAGTHWEEVNARWWTGSRWIPIYAFDINTLEDLFDIADGDGVVSLLPDTNSFFRWWQLQWLDFRAWLEDALANIGSGTGPGSGSDCQHVYSSEVSREPGCVEPGTTLYTCSNCGHQYTELIDAHGHDWITTDTVPDVLDENGTVIEKGYEILTCSVCDATAKDYGDGPEEDDLFDALGDLLAGGVEWLLDKLTQLADRLRLITDTFTEYIEKVKDFGGEYPAFFAAAFLLIPEELRILFWLAVVGVVVLAVWKKYSS